MRIFLFLFSLLLLTSCAKDTKQDIDVSGIEAHTVIDRFDTRFFTATPDQIPELKKDYPYLFPAQFHDSVWENKMTDKYEKELFAETQKVFGDFKKEEEQLNALFKHIKYYFPEFKEPKVITLISSVDADNRVILADSLLLISLDVYLGKDHKFYSDFPKYERQNFNPSHLIVDVAFRFAEQIVPGSRDKSFVSRMIYEGKKVVLVEHLLPEVPEEEILGYTTDQMDWANENEAEVWKYFIENQLLFSNDPELSRRFIDEAPFSKFYTANDQDSPGRIGVWFGRNIVESYLEHNDIPLKKMLVTPNEIIFKKSKYKPKK